MHFRNPVTIETSATRPGRYTDSVQLELRSITVRRADSRGRTVSSPRDLGVQGPPSTRGRFGDPGQFAGDPPHPRRRSALMFRRSFATLGGGVAIRVVAEFTEHPGAEDDTKSWQGAVDVGVRVCLKTVGQGGLEVGELAVEFGDDAAAVVVAANAAVIAGGALSCSEPSAARMVWARASVLRWRPAFFRIDRIEATDSAAPFFGVGAPGPEIRRRTGRQRMSSALFLTLAVWCGAALPVLSGAARPARRVGTPTRQAWWASTASIGCAP